jgi:hypothetical protein
MQTNCLINYYLREEGGLTCSECSVVLFITEECMDNDDVEMTEGLI